MTAGHPEHNSAGVYVSLPTIYQEQLAQGRTLASVQSDVQDLGDDVTALQADMKDVKSRQWPPLATSILGGTVVAAAAAALGLIAK